MYIHYRQKDSNVYYNRVELLINGIIVGDVLDDNSYIEDGFRLHDLYHIGLYQFFKIENGVIQTLIEDLPRTYKNNIEECVVLLMFEYSKYKEKHGLTNTCMFDTIIDLLSQLGINDDKETIREFINHTYETLKKVLELFVDFNNDVFLTTKDNNKFKIT